MNLIDRAYLSPVFVHVGAYGSFWKQDGGLFCRGVDHRLADRGGMGQSQLGAKVGAPHW
jgi:hypothetical protein